MGFARNQQSRPCAHPPPKRGLGGRSPGLSSPGLRLASDAVWYIIFPGRLSRRMQLPPPQHTRAWMFCRFSGDLKVLNLRRNWTLCILLHSLRRRPLWVLHPIVAGMKSWNNQTLRCFSLGRQFSKLNHEALLVTDQATLKLQVHWRTHPQYLVVQRSKSLTKSRHTITG